MRRPNRALCLMVLGLAVLIGCAKKKTETVASGNTAPTPAAGPAPAPPTGKVDPDAIPSGRTSSVFTAEGEAAVAKAPPKVGGDTVAGGKAAVVPPTGETGPVEMLQCRFDKVEAALAAAKGKVVFVDCWARWCPPCLTSFPKLVEKHEKYKDKGLVCVSVSIDQGQKRFTPDQVLAFLKENATFQNFYMTDVQADDPKMDARFGQITGIPHAVLFNKKGDKIWHGHPMDGKVTAMIEAELAK